jgi:hypothetical protein
LYNPKTTKPKKKKPFINAKDHILKPKKVKKAAAPKQWKEGTKLAGAWNKKQMRDNVAIYHAEVSGARPRDNRGRFISTKVKTTPKPRNSRVPMSHFGRKDAGKATTKAIETTLHNGKKVPGKYVGVQLAQSKKRNPEKYTVQERPCYKGRKGGQCYVRRNALPVARCANGRHRKRNGNFVASKCSKK